MKKLISLTFISIFITATSIFARPVVNLSYEVTPDTANRYLNVKVTCKDTGTGQAEPFTLKMPVWAPGYYLIVDFPKYLTDFSAKDSDGTAIQWQKQGKNSWVITPKSNETTVTYRIFADARSVAESRVENDVAFIAPNGVFMYVDGQKENPVDVTYKMPSNWANASTGLKPIGQTSGTTRSFTAPNYDVLYDSPVLLGNHYVKKFTHEGHEYEFALETPDGFEESSFESDFKKMVSATTQLMGHVPYDNYCLIHLGKGQGGLEHHNSQACYTEGTFRFQDDSEYNNYMSFTTHEYFHLYNVKSIRPIELGPFDYDKEVFTPMLWVSEGFTVYYETRIMLSAGIIDSKYLLNDLSSYIKTIESNEGHRHMSLRQSSYDIWLNFFNSAANGQDVRISYYNKGPILGLLFDIDIRRKTNNEKSLDDLMRLLYNRFYIEKQRGFTEEEFWESCAEIAGQSLTQMRQYVDTTDEIDYENILASAGLQLDRTTWTLKTLDNPTKEQKKLCKQMGFTE